jgi:hypothetical protein
MLFRDFAKLYDAVNYGNCLENYDGEKTMGLEIAGRIACEMLEMPDFP